MPKITWFSGFSVKIESFDNEHKELVRLLNNLYDAIPLGVANQILPTILHELVNYTKSHFKHEEEAFEKYGFPEAEAHKLEHDAFVKKIERFYKKFNEGSATLSMDVFEMLHDWVKNHIMQSDKAYTNFLLAAGMK
jgi:hemerythrin